jgi:class 3 adenylate cyclase
VDRIEDLQDAHGRLAYAVRGSGPPLVFVPDLFIPIDAIDEDPPYARFLDGLASFATVVVFDRRGIGFSDRIEDWSMSVFDTWGHDIERIVDGVCAGPATVLGVGTQSAMAAIAAARRAPDRVARLLLLNPVDATYAGSAGEAVLRNVDEPIDVDFGALVAPSRIGDVAYGRWIERAGRRGVSPVDARRTWQSVIASVGTADLDRISVQTTVLVRPDVPWSAVAEAAADIVAGIPGATRVELAGADLFPNCGDVDELVAAIAEQLGASSAPAGGTELVTLLFSDIVASTERTGALGNARWRGLLDLHDEVAASAVARHGGRLVKHTGDGVLATFPLPSRGVRAATALRSQLAPSDLEVRVALHTAEVERRGDDVNGVGVNVTARILGRAEPGEILVSAAIPLLLAGSGFSFVTRGRHELRGVPGDQELFALVVDGG